MMAVFFSKCRGCVNQTSASNFEVEDNCVPSYREVRGAFPETSQMVRIANSKVLKQSDYQFIVGHNNYCIFA
jgi:hypothetical protein